MRNIDSENLTLGDDRAHKITSRIQNTRSACFETDLKTLIKKLVSYGPPWAHYLGGYQDRLLGGPLGLLGLCHTAPVGVGSKDYGGELLR
jgi:hypothetical protein